jgi:hypothetical protein
MQPPALPPASNDHLMACFCSEHLIFQGLLSEPPGLGAGFFPEIPRLNRRWTGLFPPFGATNFATMQDGVLQDGQSYETKRNVSPRYD